MLFTGLTVGVLSEDTLRVCGLKCFSISPETELGSSPSWRSTLTAELLQKLGVVRKETGGSTCTSSDIL